MGKKVIIAGSRGITDYETVEEAMELTYPPDDFENVEEIVHGGADGVDTLGDRWAREHDIPTKRFLPKYGEFDNPGQAPLARNIEMARYADVLVAVWDGSSTGTRHMIDRATEEGCEVYVKVVG